MTNAQDMITSTPALNVMLACQPILTGDWEVAAFDLILQQSGSGNGVTMDDIRAIVPLVLENYSRIYQGGKTLAVPSYIHLSQQMLLDPKTGELPPESLVLALQTGDRIHPELPPRLHALAREGHRLALCHYTPGPALEVLLDAVRVVRLDLSTLAPEDVPPLVAELGGRDIELLADGIATREQFLRCRDLGFHYFQGTFLSEVAPVRGRKIGGNKLLLLQLLEKLRDPNATAASLEALAIRDANLTYRLLRIVNSAAQGIRREVDTLSQAITLLGTGELERWVNLFLVEAGTDKPGELTRNMLVRARMCEILAELDGRPVPVNHFIVGLLSQLDAAMDISMPELVEQLPLGPEARVALLRREGSQGEILTEVEHYEQGRFDQLNELFDPTYYEVAYRHACAWARQIQCELGASGAT